MLKPSAIITKETRTNILVLTSAATRMSRPLSDKACCKD